MSNGHACCVLGLCCPPLRQTRELDAKLAAWHATAASSSAQRTVGESLLGMFDLAPKGLTGAVAANWKKTDAELGSAVRAVFALVFAETQSSSPQDSPGPGGGA